MPAVLRCDHGRDVWFVDFRYRRRRVRKYSPVQTRRGAEQYERTLRNELIHEDEAGRDPFGGPTPTFAEFADRWMRDYVLPHNRPSSIRSKRAALRLHLLPTLGGLRLDEITTRRIDEFTTDLLAKKLSSKTVNNTLSMLRCSLVIAEEWGLLAKVPRVRWLPVVERPVRFLSEAESTKLLLATQPGFWRTFIVFLLRTGVRFSEAAALQWADIDLDAAYPRARIWKGGADGVVGPTKTRFLREVPLSPAVIEELRAHPRDGELVFPKLDGGMMNPAPAVKYLYRICKRAGLGTFGWHVLRHTCATRLTAAGVPLRVVQELLGHTTLKMTARYAHVEVASLRRTAALLEDAIPMPWSNGQPRVSSPANVVPVGHDTECSSPSIRSVNANADLVGRRVVWSG